MRGRRGEVEMRRKGNEGDRAEETMKAIAIEEDQNGDFWSVLVDLYT
jgi:hypothetical protein